MTNASLIGRRARRAAGWMTIGMAALLSVAAPREARGQSCNYIQEVPVVGDFLSSASFVNIYWGAGWNTGASPDVTMTAIDAFTKALIDSTYLASSSSNYGPMSWTFFDSWNDTISPFPPVPQSTSTMDIPYMSNEVNWVLQNHWNNSVPNPVVNLILPPGSMSVNLANNSCVAGNYSAFHTDSNLTSTPFTVILLNPSCYLFSNSTRGRTPTFTDVAEDLSHEMVETMTDNDGRGWIHLSGPTGASEVCDVCETSTDFPHDPFAPFLSTTVDKYFSDHDCGCVPSWTGAVSHFNPLQLAVSTDHTSVQLKLVGSNLGGLPSRFPLPTTLNTPYLQLTVTRGSTTLFAGNSIHAGGDAQLVPINMWTQGEIDAQVPVAFLQSCDSVDLTTWAPAGGATAEAQATFAAPFSITISAPSNVNAGQTYTVSGTVTDVSSAGVPGAQVTLQGASPLSFGGSNIAHVTTDATGAFATTFTMSATGRTSITASVPACAGPALTQTLPIVATATSLRCVPVAAGSSPNINLIYSPSGIVSGTDTFGSFPVTAASGGTGTGRVWTRTILGQSGAPAAGLQGYEYQVDMTNASTVMFAPFIQTVAIPFGRPTPFDFDGDGILDDCYVITVGGIGDRAPTSATLDAGEVTLRFGATPLQGVQAGHESYFVGMLAPASSPPVVVTDQVNDNGITAGVQLRVPAPPVVIVADESNICAPEGATPNRIAGPGAPSFTVTSTGLPTDPPVVNCPGCNPGTSTYQLTDALDTLKIVYFGLTHDGSYDCNGSVRRSLVDTWKNLFATDCATGDSQCSGGLDHAWRESDLSPDTSALVGILAPPGKAIGTLSTASPHARAPNPFCNSHDANSGTVSYADEGSPTSLTGLTFSTPADYQDFDPIRRASAPVTTTSGDTVSRGHGGTAPFFAGTSGLVLPIALPPVTSPPVVATTDLYAAPLCSPPGTSGPCDLVGIIKGSQIPAGFTCPDGTAPTLGACYMPVPSLTNRDPRCIADHTSRCFGEPNRGDGRAYNMVVVVPTSTIPAAQQNPTFAYQFALDSHKRIMSGAFFRMHERFGSPNADTTSGQTGVCQQLTDSDQVSCLADADPCTVGLSNTTSLKFFPPMTPALNKPVYP
jgi:hypothetical protein